MKWMLALVALLGLAVYPAMAASPDEKSDKKLVTGQKQSQEEPIVPKPPLGSMVSIPAGEFTMGSEDGDADERPAHKVIVDSFSIDVYEVTVGEYGDFLRSGGGHLPPGWEKMNQTKYHKRPVMGVDWADVAAYRKPVDNPSPTEAEWEKAARGTDGRVYPWGNDSPSSLHANYGKYGTNDLEALSPVGSLEKGKSFYGVYDMAGNVWEWVSDWYDTDYYKNSPQQNPEGLPTGGFKVIRGGAWNSSAKNLRSSDRYWDPPSFRSLYLPGFRCVKKP
jgi:formylglycine-generating enzyme required for sulfatase activity